MKPETNRLFHDLLHDQEGDTRRAATLIAGRRVLRYKRWKRLATGGTAILGLLAAVALSLRLAIPHTQPPVNIVAPTPAVHYLSDDQLLAIFTNTPVGLASVHGRKVLIFPRPGDQERYMSSF